MSRGAGSRRASGLVRSQQRVVTGFCFAGLYTVIESLRENDVSSWLAAVRRHHSYTYRHSMHVTGLAVAFGLELGIRQADVERLAINRDLLRVELVSTRSARPVP